MNRNIMSAFVWILLAGCTHQSTFINKTGEDDDCLQEAYNIYNCKYLSYTDWKIAYMNYITFCINDTNRVIQLAKMDAENGDYSLFVYGLLESAEPYETIYKKYPISFHNPGCTSSEMGEIYNREMKLYLKQNEGLYYDSIYQAERNQYEKNQEEI